MIAARFLASATAITMAVVVSIQITSAAARDLTKAQRTALNNFHHEMAECYAYFHIIAHGIEDREEDKPIAARYRKSADSLMRVMADVQKMMGMTDEAALARVSLEVDKQMAAMSNDYVNISVLLRRFAMPCKELLEHPEARLQHWIDRAR